MASSAFSILTDTGALKRRMQRISGPAASVCANPFGQGRGLQVAKIMRTGPKGVYRQFVDQTEYRNTASIPWARTKAFGNKPAPRKTMLGTGLYRSAWMGGAGGTEKITATSVELGVDRGLFPQARIHQSRSAKTKIKPTVRMRWFLGLTYGVWLSKATMRKGFTIARRRVSVSSDVRKTALKFLRNEIGSKIKLPRLTTAAIR